MRPPCTDDSGLRGLRPALSVAPRWHVIDSNDEFELDLAPYIRFGVTGRFQTSVGLIVIEWRAVSLMTHHHLSRGST